MGFDQTDRLLDLEELANWTAFHLAATSPRPISTPSGPGHNSLMSIPTAVFLDTSVFAGQQYNFSSTAFESFIPVAKDLGLKLLLPDPTEREIKAQIQSRSEEALKALEQARRKAPFLSKWKHFPSTTSKIRAGWEVRRIASREWQSFMSQFQLVRLGYDGISLPTIMEWYFDANAPFGTGSKRKEFPDAFTIAILELYAQNLNEQVAIVSADGDFRAACERFSSLFYFPSISRLTELLLSSTEELSTIRAALEGDLHVVEEALANQVESFVGFYHYHHETEISSDRVLLAWINDTNIVAIGDGECTITFDAEVESEHEVTWQVYRDDTGPEYVSATVTNIAPVSGAAKLSIDAKTKVIDSVNFISVDDNEIEITMPPHDYV